MDEAYTSGRGGRLMERVKQGNIVKEFSLGNTKVRIADDFCRDKTPEEVDAILKRISCIALNHMLSKED